MKDPKKKHEKPEKQVQPEIDGFETNEVASNTEFTGLISSAPTSEYEYISYQELMNFRPDPVIDEPQKSKLDKLKE